MTSVRRTRAFAALAVQGVPVAVIARTARLSPTRVGQMLRGCTMYFWHEMVRETRRWEDATGVYNDEGSVGHESKEPSVKTSVSAA